MKAIAVGSMRPKAAGSGERTSVVVRSGSVRLGIIGNRGIAEISLLIECFAPYRPKHNVALD